MESTKNIGMDVHRESLSIAVLNSAGKLVMKCVIDTKASVVLRFVDGLTGDLQVTLGEGTLAAIGKTIQRLVPDGGKMWKGQA